MSTSARLARRVDYDKYRAPKILKTVQERLLDGNLIKKPLWFDAVSMFPPIHRPVAILHNDPTRFTATLAQSKEQQEKFLENADKYCQKMPNRKWSSIKTWKSPVEWRKAVLDASRVLAFPQEIEFPEDKLRERFYHDHPFEKSRPRILKEDLSTSPGSGSGEFDVSSVCTGEDVAQYQQYLMNRSKDPLAEDEAYRLACQQFYENRVREEQKLRDLRLQAQALHASISSEPVHEDSSESDNVQLNEEDSHVQGHAVGQDNLAERRNTASDLILDQWLKLEQVAVERAVEIKNEETQARRERDSAMRKTAASV